MLVVELSSFLAAHSELKCIHSRFGRLVLLEPPPAFDDALVELFSSPAGHQATLRTRFSVDELQRKRDIAKWTGMVEEEGFAVLLKDVLQDGEALLVGYVSLYDIEKTSLVNQCGAGVMIVPAFCRMGIATEALYTIIDYAISKRGIRRVMLETTTENKPMRKWLEEVALLQLEGTARECYFNGEKWLSACTYSILDREWGGVRKLLEERLRQGGIGREEKFEGKGDAVVSVSLNLRPSVPVAPNMVEKPKRNSIVNNLFRKSSTLTRPFRIET